MAAWPWPLPPLQPRPSCPMRWRNRWRTLWGSLSRRCQSSAAAACKICGTRCECCARRTACMRCVCVVIRVYVCVRVCTCARVCARARARVAVVVVRWCGVGGWVTGRPARALCCTAVTWRAIHRHIDRHSIALITSLTVKPLGPCCAVQVLGVAGPRVCAGAARRHQVRALTGRRHSNHGWDYRI